MKVTNWVRVGRRLSMHPIDKVAFRVDDDSNVDLLLERSNGQRLGMKLSIAEAFDLGNQLTATAQRAKDKVKE